jgi:hypothetical protein
MREGRGRIDLAAQESLAERAEGHETDAKRLKRRQDLRFDVSREQWVFALHRGDGLDGVRPADRLRSCFAQTEVDHLALCDPVANGACDVFDRHRRIDTMLVEEIDPVGLHADERLLRDQPNTSGGAV